MQLCISSIVLIPEEPLRTHIKLITQEDTILAEY